MKVLEIFYTEKFNPDEVPPFGTLSAKQIKVLRRSLSFISWRVSNLLAGLLAMLVDVKAQMTNHPVS